MSMASLFSQPAAANEPLRLVVEVNEGVRQVIGVSRRVNLVAINAMIVAKQAGRQASGFQVVSAELRRFSGQLDLQMQDLDRFIASLVHTVAGSARVRRHRAHLDAIDPKSPASAAIADAKQRIDTARRRIDDESAERWCDLRKHLDQALRLCGTGVALSRAAKIEAVYASTLGGDLRQVADEIEAAILSILGILKTLRSDVAR
ncbi:hypothetical protein OTERR_11320 [Oryzomicrobium terrae]|uniref:Methyl-accepting chemotaxis protein n=1 Tax=Oryzomicrobium terrae TaxID=1735038 RepID=A0A5C1E8Q4_9RHOO|nr:hypothetical protein [Oryzomicrobium terrae]QEL64608.1 hypothetical protein OTERR_11320 [Oryzomicrobium terrae]